MFVFYKYQFLTILMSVYVSNMVEKIRMFLLLNFNGFNLTYITCT